MGLPPALPVAADRHPYHPPPLLSMAHPHRAPFVLVDSQTLNEYSSREGRDTRSGGHSFHVRGLCLATVYRCGDAVTQRGPHCCHITEPALRPPSPEDNRSVATALFLCFANRLFPMTLLPSLCSSVPTIMRTVGLGGLQVRSVSTPLMDQARTTCSVTAILVMYGLPRLLTGCIIAHELMHAWLRMRHVAQLDPQVSNRPGAKCHPTLVSICPSPTDD